MNRITEVFRQQEILTYFAEYPDHSPIGNNADVVCSINEIVLVKSSPKRNVGPVAGALIAVGGVAGAMIGGAASMLLEKYHSQTKDRKIEVDFLASLVDNGVALSSSCKDFSCEIQDEKRSIFEAVTWEDKTSWVTFFGAFQFASEQLHGSISMKFRGSSKQAKKAIEDALPIAVNHIEEKLSFLKLNEIWETRTLGPNARQDRIKRREAQSRSN